VTAGIAWIHDWKLNTSRLSWKPWINYSVELVAYVIYALALIFLFEFVQRQFSFPWSMAIISLCALVLFAITRPLNLKIGLLVSFMAIIVAHGVAFSRFYAQRDSSWSMLFAAAVVFVEAILYERLLAWTKGLEASPVVAALLYSDTKEDEERRPFGLSDAARTALVVTATIVFAAAVYRSGVLGAKWTTAGWSMIAVILVALGFIWKSSTYRRTALALFALCVARVFLVDTRHLSDTYKMLAFIILGLCLVGMAWLYSRFSSEIRKWL
jgi:hypothetical protein